MSFKDNGGALLVAKRLMLIESLVENESNYAKYKHEQEYFASSHEAYSVLLEELEEVEKDLLDVRSSFNEVWRNVKIDENPKAMLKMLANDAKNAIIELAQVAQVANKWIKTIEKEGRIK